jgi:hypothetical protein
MSSKGSRSAGLRQPGAAPPVLVAASLLLLVPFGSGPSEAQVMRLPRGPQSLPPPLTPPPPPPSSRIPGQDSPITPADTGGNEAPSVALMARQQARPLKGRFNTVPVLHSNQPEQVRGPGILVDTRPGRAVDEHGNTMANAAYRFQGPFGLHMHHKYAVSASTFTSSGRRAELLLAVVLSNASSQPVTVELERGAVRNSFSAPYLGRQMLGVKPLGPRAWNTGPGDATAVALLRYRLDPSLPESLTIPPRGRVVLLQERLPAQGMMNALLRGTSDGPFHISVVAAPDGASEAEVLAVLDSGVLAPGREYLAQLDAIHSGQVFSRVSGVAIGDEYRSELSHDLDTAGALHVPLTSTVRQTFGTGEVQVNRLATRTLDSALDNVGTYGVLYDIGLTLKGSGSHVLVISHPDSGSAPPFIAFRGSIRLPTPAEEESVHVGMRSGESLALTTLPLSSGQPLPLRLQLVYPADATPGHLLSVVPLSQWQLRQLPPPPEIQDLAALEPILPAVSPSPARRAPTSSRATPRPINRTAPRPAPQARPTPAARPGGDLTWRPPSSLQPDPVLRPQRATVPAPGNQAAGSLVDRYRQALEAQERMMGRWQEP